MTQIINKLAGVDDLCHLTLGLCFFKRGVHVDSILALMTRHGTDNANYLVERNFVAGVATRLESRGCRASASNTAVASANVSSTACSTSAQSTS